MAMRRSSWGWVPQWATNSQINSGPESMYSPTSIIACQRGSSWPLGCRNARQDRVRVVEPIAERHQESLT